MEKQQQNNRQVPIDNSICQLYDLPYISDRLTIFSIAFQRILKLRVSIQKRIRYLAALLMQQKGNNSHYSKKNLSISTLKPGDTVRVRSIDEIRATLNKWNKLKGCTFLPEMEAYCDTTQKIYKRVNRFLNETDYLVKKCKGIVLLENVFCEGTFGFGRCDRSCFYFWREEWLELISREVSAVENGKV